MTPRAASATDRASLAASLDATSRACSGRWITFVGAGGRGGFGGDLAQRFEGHVLGQRGFAAFLVRGAFASRLGCRRDRCASLAPICSIAPARPVLYRGLVARGRNYAFPELAMVELGGLR